MLESLIIAFSTFSKIPMPHVEWTKRGMRYSMCFLPCVGIAVGAAEYFAYLLLTWLGAGALLRAGAYAGIPLLVTGGIHMDGYLDTNDAIRSWKSREEKLEILKDPHVGAFAVIYGLLYVILQMGFASEVTREMIPVLAMSFVLSRCFSGLAVVAFPKAKKDGMLRTASDASPAGMKTAMMIELCAAAAVMTVMNPVYGLTAVAAAALMFVIYHHTAMKVFGGTTGDVAGWFIELCELVMLAAVVIAGLIISRS